MEYLCAHVAPQKKSRGVRSGEHADHEICAPLFIYPSENFIPRYCLAVLKNAGVYRSAEKSAAEGSLVDVRTQVEEHHFLRLLSHGLVVNKVRLFYLIF